MARQRLCALSELPDGRSRGFTLSGPDGAPRKIFVVRVGDAVHGYANRCPHRGTPLDWRPDDFLDREGKHIVCATHGAVFRKEDGHCLAGPCAGDALTPVGVEVTEGEIFATVPASSPASPPASPPTSPLTSD